MTTTVQHGQEGRATGPCIVCGQRTVQQFLDLGETALANKFVTQEELSKPESRYPLRVGFCTVCKHVQLTEVVPPSAMFNDYLYVSAASDTLKSHLYDLSDVVVKRLGLGEHDLVIDIGCNDGTLLTGFRRHGVRTLGVDPAENLASLTRDQGLERYIGFFSSKSAKEIVERWGHASAVTATNTFPHIPELADFVGGIRTVLAPGATFVIEAHYLVDMLEQVAFDTIYHEHVSYWALGPMQYLFERYGLEVVDVKQLPLHHGQVRVFVQRKGEGIVRSSVPALLEKERALNIDQLETYEVFAKRTKRIKKDLHCAIKDLRARQKIVVGYGAAAKGNTLLSYLEIGPELIPYIVDKSPLKQGRYTPGTHIPVVSPHRLLEGQPDFVVLLAWNFAEEILAQQQEYRNRGGKFIIPIPQVSIV